MGWKGTVRSLQAASNVAAREQQRRHRDYERQQAALSKMAELVCNGRIERPRSVRPPSPTMTPADKPPVLVLDCPKP